MADLPIIFSAPMIQALLDRRKSQTRRLPKIAWETGANQNFTGWRSEQVGPRTWRLIGGMGIGATIKTAYAVGDRLYVREAFSYGWPVEVNHQLTECNQEHAITYRANGNHPFGGGKWKPSIHMPRWASRLTLIVTDVRVQRIQDISESDAVAEGFERMKSGRGYYDPRYSHSAVHAGIWLPTAREAFSLLWNSLHGLDAWAANPWVAAISFTVSRGNIDGGDA